jgi:hypothetical protein
MNTQITASDRLYTYSDHAMEKADERGIPKEWIIETLEKSEYILEDSRGNTLYHYTIKTGGGVYPIKVVVDEETQTIVTMMLT